MCVPCPTEETRPWESSKLCRVCSRSLAQVPGARDKVGGCSLGGVPITPSIPNPAGTSLEEAWSGSTAQLAEVEGYTSETRSSGNAHIPKPTLHGQVQYRCAARLYLSHGCTHSHPCMDPFAPFSSHQLALFAKSHLTWVIRTRVAPFLRVFQQSTR